MLLMGAGGHCLHTGKPHKWVSLNKSTLRGDGATVDWWQCKGCGRLNDLPAAPERVVPSLFEILTNEEHTND